MAEAVKAPGLAGAARVLAVAALGLLSVGIFTPIMTVKRFFLLNETVTIAGMIEKLYAEGAPLLATVVLAFSVLFPAGKLFIVVAAAEQTLRLKRRLALAHVAEALGKWSMVDVFVVALTIVAIKATGLADVFDHPGVYFFGAAVLVSMAASAALVKALAPITGDGAPVEPVVPRDWYR